MLAYILSHDIQISLQSHYGMEMIRSELRFGIVYTTIVYTRPNSALDLRRQCTFSMCEQSICNVKYTGMK